MRLVLLLLALPCLALWEAPVPNGYQTSIATAKEKLASGDLGEASEASLDALAYSPYSAEAYTVLFDIASADGNKEAMLRWGKWLYWAHQYSGRNKEADTIATRITPIWADWNADEAVISDWRAEVEKAVKSAAGGDKQYRVAGHLMGKLMDLDPGDEKLQKSYDKLSEKAGEMLSGGAFLAEKVRRKSPKWIAQMNAKHALLVDHPVTGEKGNPWQKKTKNYEIVSNLGYEFVETVAIVMEDINKFYRKIYGYRKKAPRLRLAVGEPRSQFDRFCIDELGYGLSGGVLGWFYDKEMTVAAYQDDKPRFRVTMEELYSTLFHEASHQFMYLLCEKPTKQDPPTWLNEGTASYFEGCELKSDGSIVKNKPALLRVREWASIESGSSKSLEDLITCPHRNYDGSFYSYGWALVYFLNNYEGPGGQLIYRQPYLDYIKAYTKKNKHDPFELAKQLFVEEVGDPEVQNWDAFESRWRIWTQGIVRESKLGATFADTLQERTRNYLEQKDFERALIAAEQADDKRPEDRETYRLLALAYLGSGHEEEAAFWMLRHWEEAWAVEAEEEANAAENWLTENGAKDLVASYIKPTRRALARIEGLMDDAQSDNFPVAAMLFASHANQAFGTSHNRLQEAIADIAEVSGQDLRLWIRAYANDATANKQYSDGTDKIRYEEDGILINNHSNFVGPVLLCEQPTLRHLVPPYEIRGKVQVDGKNGGEIGLGIGRNNEPKASISLFNGARAQGAIHDITVGQDSGARLSYSKTYVTTLSLKPTQSFNFALEAKKEGRGNLEVNGRKTELAEEFTRERFIGKLGLSAGDEAVCLFGDIEIRAGKPFWPVSAN